MYLNEIKDSFIEYRFYVVRIILLQLQLLIMKKRSFQPKNQPTYSKLKNSNDSLQYGKHQMFTGSLQTMNDEWPNDNRQSNFSIDCKKAVEDHNKQLYRPASYQRALQYRNERSYMKKTEEGYVELDLLADTQELKYFGLGIYFYIEFFRRLCWLFFVMSLIQTLHIVINFKGDGLSSYEPSFSTYLIRSTLGNYSGASGTQVTPYDSLLVIGLPALNFLALFIFVLIWRTHIRRTVNKQEEDNTDVKPEKYCIEFQGFNPDDLEEDELKKFFSVYGPIFQASYVRSHDDKLQLFEQLDQTQEHIQDTELQITLGNGDKQALQELKKEKQLVQQEINKLSIKTFTQSAYVHFQFEKTKIECIDEFNSHYQHSGKCGHCFCRTFCYCCLPKVDEKINFKGKRLFLKTEKVPPPQDINWSSFQLSRSNRLLRAILAFFIIILFLIFSTAIISLCSLYISANSLDCQGVPVGTFTPATAATTGDPRDLQCFCNAYMIESFTNQDIKTACSSYLQGIYVSQSIQYAMIIISTIANILFGMVLNKLVEYMRPPSEQSALKDKTIIYTVFLVINTIIIPVIIYADILGVKPSSYVSIFTLISSDISNFFNVGNLQFYNGFLPIWYKNVSPMFTNYIVFDILITWIFFAIGKCCCVDKSSLEKKQGKILQKSMNNQITQFKLDASDQISNLFLIVIMVLIFFTGVPILLPLGFINILSRYLINRNLIQRHSMRMEGLGENFIQLTVVILTFSIILFSLIGEWMLMANSKVYITVIDFYGSGTTMFDSFFYELKIQLYIPLYIGIAALTVLQLIIYNTVIRFCTNLCSCCAKPIPNYHTRPFSEYSKTMNVLCSYSIRNNDKMKNSVLLIQKYIGQKMNN